MNRKLLKKLIIGGAIILSASIPVFGEQKTSLAQAEKQAMFGKRDPFVPPKNVHYLAQQGERIINSLDELARRLEKDGFDKKKVQAAYDDKRFKIHPDIANYFIFNPEKKAITYEDYRKKIGLDAKIDAGPGYFKKYAGDLFLAEDKYGVEASIDIAILGVESDYGLNLGDYRAFNAAISLYSSPKKEFAYTQLKALLNITKERHIDFMEVFSSYALCAFPGQFLLENVPKLFVGKNGDSKGDLFNMVDWVCSVANYLEEAGWNPKQNYKPIQKGSADWKAIWAYNHSDYYVRAVIELASTIRNNPEVKLLKEYHEELKKLGRMLNDIW